MPRVLVLIPTSSYRTTDFVEAAERLGIDLVVGSEEEPPIDLGDRFVRVDCDDADSSVAAIVALADTTPIDAIVAADDGGVVIAATAAQRLGLPNNPPEAARATRDKLEMRRLLREREVTQPDFQPVATPEQVSLPFPVVLKPRTASASVGVVRVDSRTELDSCFRRVMTIAGTLGEAPPLLAESFIEGAEMAIEGHVAGGNLVILAHFDKPEAPRGPFFTETLLVTPSRMEPSVLAEVDRVVGAGVSAIGLTNGPIHAEVKIDPDGRVHILEVAARSIGGLCSRSLLFGLEGSRLEDLILSAALGQRLNLRRQPRASGVLMIPVPERGTLEDVRGVDSALEVEGVTAVDMTTPPGTEVSPLPEDGRYLGFIFAQGPRPEDVVSALGEASWRLKIVIRASGGQEPHQSGASHDPNSVRRQ